LDQFVVVKVSMDSKPLVSLVLEAYPQTLFLGPRDRLYLQTSARSPQTYVHKFYRPHLHFSEGFQKANQKFLPVLDSVQGTEATHDPRRIQEIQVLFQLAQFYYGIYSCGTVAFCFLTFTLT
jgi:hypothetical protein